MSAVSLRLRHRNRPRMSIKKSLGTAPDIPEAPFILSVVVRTTPRTAPELSNNLVTTAGRWALQKRGRAAEVRRYRHQSLLARPMFLRTSCPRTVQSHSYISQLRAATMPLRARITNPAMAEKRTVCEQPSVASTSKPLIDSSH